MQKQEVIRMTETYPKLIRRNISILCDRLCVDQETAYAMLLMTAALMDLHPEDKEVLRMVLQDCGLIYGDIA